MSSENNNNKNETVCTNCVHLGPINPGSSHHRCCTVLQKDGKIGVNDILVAAYVLKKGKVPVILINEKTKEVQELIKLNEHGVKNGWCTWPIDFDQIWVEACLLKQEKPKEP